MLEVLEISNIELSGACIEVIKKVINAHATRRNEALWITDLRSSSPSHFREKEGLLELVLRNDSVDDEGIANLLSVLSFDQYLKVRIEVM
jgi:hypothetical protein